MDCLFCKIINGDIPSYKVYEDASTYAFLDINPCSEGHTVVLPKEHLESFNDMGPEEIAALFISVSRINKAIIKVLGVDGSNIGLNVGLAAGQVIPHVHVHIIPRTEGDGGGSMHSIISTETASTDLEALAKKIAEDID